MKQKATEFISLYESCFDDRQKIVKLVKRTSRGSKFKAKARLDSIPVLPEEEWTYDNPNLEEMYKKVSYLFNFSKFSFIYVLGSLFLPRQWIEKFLLIILTWKLKRYNYGH